MRTTSSPRPKAAPWLRALTSARTGALVLGIALLIGYCIVPLGLATFSKVAPSFITLAGMTALAILALALGAITPFFDPWFTGKSLRLVINARAFNAVLWTAFVGFVIVVWATAPHIPLLAALSGAEPGTIAVLRERFLKARPGWQSSFVYIDALLCGALIPYSIAMMHVHRTQMRWLATGFFLLFAISFVEKAFFFKVAIPLLYLVSQGKMKVRLSPRKMLLLAIGILLAVTYLSGLGRSGISDNAGGVSYLSDSYTPHGTLQLVIWRSLAVPLITATETIDVLQQQFGGHPLGGATSSLVANLFGMKRIDMEHLVFAAQWGQNETGTGSANSVFITEAFVNFGWIGVFIFGYVVGLLMRLFAVSRDEAFQSLWLLFAIDVYSAGLIGILMSNGYILLFFIALFVRLRVPAPAQRSAALQDPISAPPNPT